MTNRNYLTALLTGALAIVPQFIHFLPPDVATAATAGIAFVGAIYHLFQPTPK